MTSGARGRLGHHRRCQRQTKDIDEVSGILDLLHDDEWTKLPKTVFCHTMVDTQGHWNCCILCKVTDRCDFSEELLFGEAEKSRERESDDGGFIIGILDTVVNRS